MGLQTRAPWGGQQREGGPGGWGGEGWGIIALTAYPTSMLDLSLISNKVAGLSPTPLPPPPAPTPTPTQGKKGSSWHPVSLIGNRDLNKCLARAGGSLPFFPWGQGGNGGRGGRMEGMTQPSNHYTFAQ